MFNSICFQIHLSDNYVAPAVTKAPCSALSGKYREAQDWAPPSQGSCSTWAPHPSTYNRGQMAVWPLTPWRRYSSYDLLEVQLQSYLLFLQFQSLIEVPLKPHFYIFVGSHGISLPHPLPQLPCLQMPGRVAVLSEARFALALTTP